MVLFSVLPFIHLVGDCTQATRHSAAACINADIKKANAGHWLFFVGLASA
jgi:hypothetical protein